MSEHTEMMLRDRYRELCERFDHYTSPGNGAPGFAEAISKELRAIEDALVRLHQVAG